jgi:hypothetical protein
VVFFNQAARFALVGDVLFQGSIGRTDFQRRSRRADQRHHRAFRRWAMTSQPCAGRRIDDRRER